MAQGPRSKHRLVFLDSKRVAITAQDTTSRMVSTEPRMGTCVSFVLAWDVLLLILAFALDSFALVALCPCIPGPVSVESVAVVEVVPRMTAGLVVLQPARQEIIDEDPQSLAVYANRGDVGAK